MAEAEFKAKCMRRAKKDWAGEPEYLSPLLQAIEMFASKWEWPDSTEEWVDREDVMKGELWDHGVRIDGEAN